MRFNNLWITLKETMVFLLTINTRIKNVDERIKELDKRVRATEIELLISPGTDNANDTDMAANINKVKSKVEGRIE